MCLTLKLSRSHSFRQRQDLRVRHDKHDCLKIWRENLESWLGSCPAEMWWFHKFWNTPYIKSLGAAWWAMSDKATCRLTRHGVNIFWLLFFSGGTVGNGSPSLSDPFMMSITPVDHYVPTTCFATANLCTAEVYSILRVQSTHLYVGYLNTGLRQWYAIENTRIRFN